jgi:hypothetical protein
MRNARDQVQTQIQSMNQLIQQKQTLIHLANHKPDKGTKISHRLALPSSRLSVGDNFQKISHRLNLQQLDFQISPEATIDTPATPDAFTESKVELKFHNGSDQPLFHMLEHILQDFPGLVYPVEIIMERDFHSAEPHIHGTFRFEWVKSTQEKIS